MYYVRTVSVPLIPQATACRTSGIRMPCSFRGYTPAFTASIVFQAVLGQEPTELSGAKVELLYARVQHACQMNGFVSSDLKAQMSPQKVFISYARENRSSAQKARNELEGYEVEVWMDNSELLGGDNLPGRISVALEWCDKLILFWSEHASQSEWVHLEWTSAMSLGKEIIPCRLDSTPLPGILASRVCIDFTDVKSSVLELTKAIPAGHHSLPRRAEKIAQPYLPKKPRKPSPADAGVSRKIREELETSTPAKIAGLLKQSSKNALENRGGTVHSLVGSCSEAYWTPEILAFAKTASIQKKRAVLDILTRDLAKKSKYLDRVLIGLPIVGILNPEQPGPPLGSSQDVDNYVRIAKELGIAENVPFKDLANLLCSIAYDCWV